MKILFTGGSGNLGDVLTAKLLQKKDTEVIRFDVLHPADNAGGKYISGSILDRQQLKEAMSGVDVVVHIAAWHGFDEFTAARDVYEFWDLNVTGTFNVFQAAVEANIKNIVFMSSESVSDRYGVYGGSKLMAESVAETYVKRHQMNVITLRAGAFIPYWNKRVYPNDSFLEWAKWFAKGAVYITDVAAAVGKSIEALLSAKCKNEHWILDIDGAYEYTQDDIDNWDESGAHETFKKYYAEFVPILEKYKLDLMIKPNIRDISEAAKKIGYKPQYSLSNLLQDLEQYGSDVPPSLDV
jgi:nucleoside-diphosphate-sugar epimerase